jgi:hypothetical protein
MELADFVDRTRDAGAASREFGLEDLENGGVDVARALVCLQPLGRSVNQRATAR